MGRKSTSAEEKQAKKRERDRLRRLDPEILARRREQGRQRQQQLYLQAKLTDRDPLALLANTATQAHLLEEIGDDDDGGQLSGEIVPSISTPECTEVGTGSFEDEGMLIESHSNDEGRSLIDNCANSRKSC